VVLHVTAEVSGLGLQRGDLLVEVNGDVPTAGLQFVEALTRVRAADTIRIVYVRDGVETLLRIPPGYLGRPAIAGQ
jgi:type II secretory pathway component PulC